MLKLQFLILLVVVTVVAVAQHNFGSRYQAYNGNRYRGSYHQANPSYQGNYGYANQGLYGNIYQGRYGSSSYGNRYRDRDYDTPDHLDYDTPDYGNRYGYYS